jgi:hypothetical protein
MNEPTIICPNCKTEIKLTESLAAPLIQATRKEYEQKIAQKENDVAAREAAIRQQEAELIKEKASFDEQVTAKIKSARTEIALEEAKKARLLVASDIEQKEREVLDLQAVLNERDKKLAQAQMAQADLIRKQRELGDAKREMDLNIEKRVQASLAIVRDKAKQEAEDGLKSKVLEKETQIASNSDKLKS